MQPKADPIFAAIEAHRVACQRHDAIACEDDALTARLRKAGVSFADEGRHPDRIAYEARYETSFNARKRAARKIGRTTPTSIVGAAALSSYLSPEIDYMERFFDSDTAMALRTLNKALQALAAPSSVVSINRKAA